MNFAVFFFFSGSYQSVSFCKNSNAIVLAFCVHNFQIHLTTINDLFKFTKPVVVSECVVDFESANTVIPCQGLCVCVCKGATSVQIQNYSNSVLTNFTGAVCLHKGIKKMIYF